MNRGRSGGFTIIELLVVLAIISLMAALTVPTLRFSSPSPASGSAAVLEVMHAARLEALREGNTFDLVIEGGSDRWWLLAADRSEVRSGSFAFGETAHWLPADARRRIRFRRSGEVVIGGRLEMVDDDGTIRHLAWSGRRLNVDRFSSTGSDARR